jgi:hypothetical protein
LYVSVLPLYTALCRIKPLLSVRPSVNAVCCVSRGQSCQSCPPRSARSRPSRRQHSHARGLLSARPITRRPLLSLPHHPSTIHHVIRPPAAAAAPDGWARAGIERAAAADPAAPAELRPERGRVRVRVEPALCEPDARAPASQGQPGPARRRTCLGLLGAQSGAERAWLIGARNYRWPRR